MQHTDVKDQAIGNCWIYASVGWAEALHKRYTSQELNLSESYITYWHWLEQISGGTHGEAQIRPMSEDADEITTGGYWGVAGEIMQRYGLMAEGTFIPEEEAIRSDRQASALNAINASLRDGVLSNHDARRDPAIVRAELDKAWQLTPEAVETLNTVFGPAVERTVYYEPLYLGTDIFGPNDLAVGHVDGEYGRQVVSLAQAIGWSSGSDDWPGNVRELDNIVERAMILHRGEPLSFEDLGPTTAAPEAPLPVPDARPLELDAVVSQHIRRVLKMTGGTIHGASGAGEVLAVNPNTLRYKMRKLGIPFRRESTRGDG